MSITSREFAKHLSKCENFGEVVSLLEKLTKKSALGWLSNCEADEYVNNTYHVELVDPNVIRIEYKPSDSLQITSHAKDAPMVETIAIDASDVPAESFIKKIVKNIHAANEPVLHKETQSCTERKKIQLLANLSLQEATSRE